jgi:hypothetical protein
MEELILNVNNLYRKAKELEACDNGLEAIAVYEG